MRYRNFWLILLWVIIIGARLWVMTTHYFWEDELWSLYFGTTPKSFVHMIVYPPDDRPPLYHMFVRAIMDLRMPVYWLRLTSLAAGVLTIWILVQRVQKVFPKLGNLVVLTAGTSLILIDASWQFREYAFLGLVAAIQVSYWLEWFQGAEQKHFPSNHWWRLWAILSVCGVGLSYVYLPFWGAVCLSWFGLLCWWCEKSKISEVEFLKQSWALFWTSLPVGLMSAVYLYAAQWKKIEATTLWIPKPSLSSVTSLLSTLTMWNNYIWEYRTVSLGEQQHLVLLAVFWVICLGMTQWWLWRQRQFFLWWFNWWGLSVAVLNIGVTVGMSYFFDMAVFLPRFFTPLAVISAVMWAIELWVLDHVWRRTLKPFARMLGLMAYALVFWGFLTKTFQLGPLTPRQNFSLPQLTQTITELYKPGDQLVFLPDHYQDIMPLYYFPADKFPGAQNFYYYQEQLTHSSSLSPSHPWSKHQLFIVVANLLINPNSNFYEPGGYESYSMNLLRRYLSYCETKPKEPIFGNEYSFYRCTLR